MHANLIGREWRDEDEIGTSRGEAAKIPFCLRARYSVSELQHCRASCTMWSFKVKMGRCHWQRRRFSTPTRELQTHCSLFQTNASQTVLVWVRSNFAVLPCCYSAFQQSFAHTPPISTNHFQRMDENLVGGFNPSEKYESQLG